MIVQQIKNNKFTLELCDTSTQNPWIKKPKMKKYLKAYLSMFEDFVLNKSNLGFAQKGVKELHLTLTLCGATKIRSLNRDYRGKDKKTDVLSFPVHEDLRAFKGNSIESMLHLGDVIVCKEVALSQAKRFKIDTEGETIHLLVHGFLHVLGFDHEISEKEEKLMESYENQLLSKVSKKLKR